MRNTLALVFVLVSVNVLAGKLEKGFAALRIYNYFRAQELFTDCRDRHPSGAGYGLALIYYRSDNPFHDTHRAHQQILSSRWTYATSSVKEKIRLLKLGVNDSVIVLLERKIDTAAYLEAEKIQSVAAWNIYIDEYCGSSLIESAVAHRNRIAFNEALQSDTWEAFRDFILLYPEAKEIPQAKTAYDRRYYETMTADSSLNSYITFVRDNPQSPYKPVAEDMIYKKSFTAFTIEEYHAFIRTYPENRNVPDAWKSLYALYTADGSSVTIGQFWLKYPDFPFRETISEDLRLSMTVFYPVRDQDKWGFADSTGKMLIACQYEWVESFYEGVAAAGLNGKCGYINKNGSVAIPFVYDDGEKFSHGLAQIISDGKTGLSNKAGNFVVPAVYEEISGFFETRARVTRNGLHGFIDMMGTEVVPCRYNSVGDFSEGLAYIEDSSGFGFIDREGRTVIAPQYEWAEPFQNGVARVRKNNLYGIIDRTGKVIIPCEYNFIAPFSEDKSLVVKEALCGYIRNNGSWITELKYDYNRTLLGESPFVNGRARVLLKDKMGMIDTAGKIIVPREYDDLGAFREGFFPAKKKDKWGYIDAAMKLRVQYKYDYAWPYSGGIAKVKKDGMFGYIDLKGNEIIKCIYSETAEAGSEFIKVRNEDGWGLIDRSGNLVLPCYADRLEFISTHEIKVEHSDKFGYFNLIRCEYFWKENEFVTPG